MLEYSYDAEVMRWVDGDTVWLKVDLGFRMVTMNDFRLYGVDTPERGQPGWAEASAFAKEAAPSGSKVTITTYKDPDKYGRWLVQLAIEGQPTVNSQLILNGHAKAYFGGKKAA